MIPMLSHGFTWWGFLLMGIAILHFIRRRPETYWLYIIIIGQWIGALVYIACEIIPDLGLMRGTFQGFRGGGEFANCRPSSTIILRRETMRNWPGSIRTRGSTLGRGNVTTRRLRFGRTRRIRSTVEGSALWNSATLQQPCLIWNEW